MSDAIQPDRKHAGGFPWHSPAEGRCGACPLPSVCEEHGRPSLPGALLGAVLEHRQLEIGETLYRAGEKRGSIWVISGGALKTCELDLEGREQVVGFHGKGAVLGIERIEVAEHRGFALALERTRVCRIPIQRLLATLRTVPELWHEVLRIAGQQIGQAREMHRVLGQLQTGQRLTWFLLNGSGPEHRHCECSGAHRVHLPMQRQDIASFLGMTLESVSRSFSALQREGVIEVKGRHITLLDPAGLAERLATQERTAA